MSLVFAVLAEALLGDWIELLRATKVVEIAAPAIGLFPPSIVSTSCCICEPALVAAMSRKG